jgi:hypothetical protein
MMTSRRGFLKMLGIGLGAAALTAAKAKLPPMLSELVDGDPDEQLSLSPAQLSSINAILKEHYLSHESIQNVMIEAGPWTRSLIDAA